MAELEHRLTGSTALNRLHPELAAHIPEARTYVAILFDGLGAHQLAHPDAASLAAAHRAPIDAPFPTTTTVSLATIATGLAPAGHGLLGHIIRLGGRETVVNALKWIAPGGAPVNVDTDAFLPSPNLWERVRAAGCEPITVQPGHFADTPLSTALYRGCRFESIWSHEEFADATVELAGEGRRLIFAYLPEVDFAAHLFGQESEEYTWAIRTVADAWDAIAARLPSDVALIGTADHGHLDYAESGKVHLARADIKGLTVYGDPRALYVSGKPALIDALEAMVPAERYGKEELRAWWGPGDHPEIGERGPDAVFLANDGRLLIPGHMDKRLTGYHGGLDPRELRVPLLVAG